MSYIVETTCPTELGDLISVYYDWFDVNYADFEYLTEVYNEGTMLWNIQIAFTNTKTPIEEAQIIVDFNNVDASAVETDNAVLEQAITDATVFLVTVEGIQFSEMTRDQKDKYLFAKDIINGNFKPTDPYDFTTIKSSGIGRLGFFIDEASFSSVPATTETVVHVYDMPIVDFYPCGEVLVRFDLYTNADTSHAFIRMKEIGCLGCEETFVEIETDQWNHIILVHNVSYTETEWLDDKQFAVTIESDDAITSVKSFMTITYLTEAV